MSTYFLKDKLKVTKDFITELENKSWAEIDNLQNQINNIETTEESKPLVQLIKGLLTSYYVFVGGLENLSLEANSENFVEVNSEKNNLAAAVEDSSKEVLNNADLISNDNSYEPFEYFVDFDEPSGEPLSDEDLYKL